ncbi:MAG: histidinol-phosphate transaminase [Chloroflexota bacterium]|nr:MAG: histidinol-phosphate transaminase [Chloroflexota bacterium]
MELPIRPDIAKIEDYIPIEPLEILSERLGIPIERLIKLDGNENPYGCSPAAQAALASYPRYNIYPDPSSIELRRCLSEFLGVGVEHIFAGSGSDELLDLIVRLFILPGDKVINCTPTFGMYSYLTEIAAGVVTEVPRNAAYEVDIPAIKAAIDQRTKLIFVASPNNPSGNLVSESQIRDLLETGLVVVVDEAYHEFARETVLPLVFEHPNLIVLRTLSKWAGLAGLRVGYGVFPLEIIRHLWKIKQPYNVNVAGQVAAVATLRDWERMRGYIDLIIRERERLTALLAAVPCLRPLPSSANFVLCKVLDGNARAIRDALAARGILIRYFDTPLLRGYIRVSVGTPEQTDVLIRALNEIRR